MASTESSSLKHYNSDEIDIIAYYKFFSKAAGKEVYDGAVVEPIRKLQQAFATEPIGGVTLVDCSLGPIMPQIFAICKHFQQLFILDYHDQCIEEMRKWMNNDSGAHDWGSVLEVVAQNDNNSPQETKDLVQRKFKGFAKCDLGKKNPTDPQVTPKADCAISMWIIEYVSDKDNFQQHLANMSSLVKTGGYLILCTDMLTTYIIIGKDKFYAYSLSTGYLRTSLEEAGYDIKIFEPIAQDSTTDQYDTKTTMFVVAKKK